MSFPLIVIFSVNHWQNPKSEKTLAILAATGNYFRPVLMTIFLNFAQIAHKLRK